MLIKVRMAPFERWCEGARAEFARRQDTDSCEGLTVELETTSTSWWPYCDGHVWSITQKTRDEMRRRNQREPVPRERAGVCEHMLELGDLPEMDSKPTPKEMKNQFNQLRGMIESVASAASLFLCRTGKHWISKPWIGHEDEHEFRLICPDCKAEYVHMRERTTPPKPASGTPDPPNWEEHCK